MLVATSCSSLSARGNSIHSSENEAFRKANTEEVQYLKGNFWILYLREQGDFCILAGSQVNQAQRYDPRISTAVLFGAAGWAKRLIDRSQWTSTGKMRSGYHGICTDVGQHVVLWFVQAVMKEIGVKPPEIDTTECLVPTASIRRPSLSAPLSPRPWNWNLSGRSHRNWGL